MTMNKEKIEQLRQATQVVSTDWEISSVPVTLFKLRIKDFDAFAADIPRLISNCMVVMTDEEIELAKQGQLPAVENLAMAAMASAQILRPLIVATLMEDNDPDIKAALTEIVENMSAEICVGWLEKMMGLYSAAELVETFKGFFGMIAAYQSRGERKPAEVAETETSTPD